MASNIGLKRVMRDDEKHGVPMCIYWEANKVADWIVEFGYPQYRECFERNFIAGKDLLAVDASQLPNMGITDFEHIKDITAGIRALLGLQCIIKDMTLAMHDPMIAYMEMKRVTGTTTEETSFREFCRKNKKWFKIISCV